MRSTHLLPFVLCSFFLLGCTPVSRHQDPKPSSSMSSVSSATSSIEAEVIIDSPQENATVLSPLTVTGKARGSWFFEASLPVQITDSQGNILATEPAQAKGEWMTTNFVEFSTVLTFKTQDTSGFLIVKKDNPSGVPENDAQVKIAVKF